MTKDPPLQSSAIPSERDAILRVDFLAFFEAIFPVVESSQILEPTWHHDAIAKELVDSIGRQPRRYIAAPPRSLKSIIVSVAWVAFTLGHKPGHKFLCASYSHDLANYHAGLCRKLMQSELYCR